MSFLLPSAENLYRILCPTGVNCTHGNTNLAPEQSLAVNLSLGGQITFVQRMLEWQLNGWDRTVDNLITTAPTPVAQLGAFPAGFTRTFINIPDKIGANVAVKFTGEKTANVTGFGPLAYANNYVVDAGVYVYLDQARAHRVTLRLENLLDETYATAVNSAVLAGTANQHFLWQRLAPPRTVQLNYSYYL